MTLAYQGAAQSADEQARRKRTRRVVMASVAGNAMEWYDFFIYGTAAALVFGELFFPKGTDPLLGTMGAFAGFAVGFLARPLGGVVFGHIGDRYGRKLALEWTLGIMGAATFLIGLLPTYEQVGIWAPVAMVVLRVLQGAAAGGEWGGGVLLISEAVGAWRPRRHTWLRALRQRWKRWPRCTRRTGGSRCARRCAFRIRRNWPMRWPRRPLGPGVCLPCAVARR